MCGEQEIQTASPQPERLVNYRKNKGDFSATETVETNRTIMGRNLLFALCVIEAE